MLLEKFGLLEAGEKIFATHVDVGHELRCWIESHKGCSPTNPNVYWIHYRPYEMRIHFEVFSGHKVSHGMIKRMLKEMGFKYRKLSKN